jgi:hypothetical protein
MRALNCHQYPTGSIIYFITSLQLVNYKPFSKEMLKYLFGMILNFCTCVCFFCGICQNIKFCTVLHHDSDMLFFIIYLLSKLYTFSWLHASFLHLVEHEPFSDFWVHSVKGQLDPSLAVLSVLLMLKAKIHWPRYLIFYPCCISHFLNTDNYEVLEGTVLALVILSCGIFLKNMELLVQPSVAKIT